MSTERKSDISGKIATKTEYNRIIGTDYLRPLVVRGAAVMVLAMTLFGAPDPIKAQSLAQVPPIPTQVPEYPIPGETEENRTLREVVAQRFGIEIPPTKEYYVNVAKQEPESPYWFNGYTYKAQFLPDWNLAMLNRLSTTFELLPAHFYEPDPEGKKLTIILETPVTRSKVIWCGPRNDFSHIYAPTIAIASDVLTSDNPTVPLQELAHELTHYITPEVCYPGYFDTPEELSWYKKVDDLFGESFIDTGKLIIAQITKKRDELWEKQRGLSTFQRDPEDEISMGFYSRMEYGASLQAPSEFIAVLAEHYVLGPDYFSKMYVDFFGQDTASALYGFTREIVFQGKEYKLTS